MAGRNQEQLIYRLLLTALSPLLLLYLSVIAWREGDLRFWRQRRGRFGSSERQSPLWLHAASVGEVNAILPLVRRLHEEQPELPLLLTTVTPRASSKCTTSPAPTSHQRVLPVLSTTSNCAPSGLKRRVRAAPSNPPKLAWHALRPNCRSSQPHGRR